MPDSLALPAITLVAAALVALALVWPQGEGARSPAPFGHPVTEIELPLPPAKPTSPTALRGREPPPASNSAAHPPS
jgi:hypothetical protein